ATHSSTSTRHGPYSTNSSRSRSPGFVAFSSSWAMRENAFLPPSCHASSPQSVRTTVPSLLVTGLPGEILLPTSTTRFPFGRILPPASASTASTPASSLGEAPENKWYSANIECVLPPPKLV